MSNVLKKCKERGGRLIKGVCVVREGKKQSQNKIYNYLKENPLIFTLLILVGILILFFILTNLPIVQLFSSGIIALIIYFIAKHISKKTDSFIKETIIKIISIAITWTIINLFIGPFYGLLLAIIVNTTMFFYEKFELRFIEKIH